MRGLGLINERVQEDHAAYGIPPNPRHVNLPYPGVFVLDAEGVVTRKVFHESYRERDSGGGLVAQAIGLFTASPKAATAAGPVVTVRAWLDSPTYAWFQRLTLTVEVTVAPGHHVYGQPAAAGLVPLVRGDRIARRARGGLGHLAGAASLGPAGARRRDVGPRRHRAGNAAAHVHRGPGWSAATPSASAWPFRRVTRPRVSSPRPSGSKSRFARSRSWVDRYRRLPRRPSAGASRSQPPPQDCRIGAMGSGIVMLPEMTSGSTPRMRISLMVVGAWTRAQARSVRGRPGPPPPGPTGPPDPPTSG